MGFFSSWYSKINSLLTGRPFHTLGNFFLFNNTPQWIDLKNTEALFEQFCTNPIYFAVIMIKAREYANKKFHVVNRKTGEIEPETTSKEIPKAIYRLLNSPNPFQSRWEFLQQKKIFKEVSGNSFVYATRPKGRIFQNGLINVTTLKNIWPQYMKAKLTGKFFEATEQKDVIEKWVFDSGNNSKDFDPKDIMHTNNPNVDTKDDLILGKSVGFSLIRPLSNIMMSYESRNVLLKNRGMEGVFTSEMGDASGRVAMQQQEKDSFKEEMKEYGNLEGQKQFFFTSLPVKYTPLNRDVRKLGYFEEIATDAMIVSQAHGVPEILLKAYIEGATYENQEASVRRLYQGTLIPESEDEDYALNKFFGLYDEDYLIQGSFDHIPALQKSEKEKSESNKNHSEYLERLFLIGGITLNTWLDYLELPKRPDGDNTIFEMDEEQRNMILQMMGKTQIQSEETEIKRLNGKIKELIQN